MTTIEIEKIEEINEIEKFFEDNDENKVVHVYYEWNQNAYCGYDRLVEFGTHKCSSIFKKGMQTCPGCGRKICEYCIALAECINP